MNIPFEGHTSLQMPLADLLMVIIIQANNLAPCGMTKVLIFLTSTTIEMSKYGST